MNLSIRGRLLLAFATLLALLLLVAAITLSRLNDLTAGMREFVDHQARLAFLAQRVNQHAQEAAIQLLRLLHTQDRERRVPLYAAMDAALAASDGALGGLERAAAMGHELDADVARLIETRRQYGDAFQETVERIEIEGLPQARRHFEEKTDVLLKGLLGETLALAGHQQDLMQVEVARLDAATSSARLVVLLIAVAALLTGGVLAVLIARGIARPVHEAVAVAETIAGGEYCCPVPAGRGKEMGALMRALDTMRVSIASREERILRLAYEDTLTGLPNRTRFMEALAETVGTRSGALLLLDIDRFAPINNALGHEVGDRMLREIAQRLRQLVPAEHLVARLGGDEFALLMAGMDHAAAAHRARAILDGLRAPLLLDAQRLDVEASIGIVVFPDDGTTVTALIRRAELAMGLAKRRHDGFAFGGDVADEPPHEQLALIGEMREALVRDQFVAYFQPKLDLASGRIKGAEALLRWRHPEKGLVPPGRFIPFAEQTGFIREITPWLLRHVVGQAAEWHRDGLEIVTSVNLSTLDLACPTLVADIRGLLDETGLPARLLCLEITESALMDDPEQALRHLDEMAALGVQLSIDDYGSGQASLAYVQKLPVHELKIDRAFIDRVNDNPKNAAIVRSTLLLCRELGLSVVAEGAETPDELSWLSANQCDIVQGYGIARPMPAAEFRGWVADFGRNAAERAVA